MVRIVFMYKRIIAENLKKSALSSFLLGPRQCGKTTILKDLKHNIYIDLLKTAQFVKYNKDASVFSKEVTAVSESISLVIIDEIQRVPSLLNEVQSLTDTFGHIKFILSGSSARKLRRGGANLLGGRFQDLGIYPLTIGELERDFNLDVSLRYGSLPRISTLIAKGDSSSAEQLLRSYVSTYLTEEIRSEALVRQLDNFQRFLEVSAWQYAKEVNLSMLSDQAQVSLPSVKNYYGILEDTLIGFFLYPYSLSIRKQLSRTPKFYFFDNGVVRAIQGLVSVEPGFQEKGLLFEQYMIQEVLRINKYYQKDLKLNFWKTIHGAEVDLVLSRGNKIIFAVEFKSTPFPALRDLSGLRSFAEEYPNVKKVLCAPVERQMMLDSVKVVPPEDLCKMIIDL
jgi:uncharacterized protein